MAEEKKLNIFEKLNRIQTELKAPKNLYNNFGKYSYRNAEGICEALKPYLKEYNVAVSIEDSVESVGDRIYIKATVRFIDCDTKEIITSSAYARESLEKKGMDDSQLTGATSSYARKYALNGLFLLDDTKDADTDEFTGVSNVIDKSMKKMLTDECTRTGTKIEAVEKRIGRPIDQMTIAEFREMIEKFKSVPTKGEQTNDKC